MVGYAHHDSRRESGVRGMAGRLEQDRAVFGTVTVHGANAFTPYVGSELDTVQRIRRRLDVRAVEGRRAEATKRKDRQNAASSVAIENRRRAALNERPPVTVEDLDTLLEAVVYCLNATTEGVKGPSRVHRDAYARHLFCYLARWELDTKWAKIGATINRDYSTCVHAFRRLKAKLSAGTVESREMANDIYWIKRRLNIKPVHDAVHRKLRRVGA